MIPFRRTADVDGPPGTRFPRGALLGGLLAVAAATCLAPAAARAQDAPPQDAPAAAPIPPGPREVVGRVVRPRAEGDVPAANVPVTLHRVGPDRSGPLDSTRTDAAGRYAFRYAPTGSDEALYFVSASYGGIAYFGAPLRAARVTGDDAVVTVFDTTSTPVPLHVRGRHLIVSASDPDERRAVIEVYELSNDTTLTRVGGRDSATVRLIVPKEATDFRGGQGDIPPQAMALVDGRVEVYAPFAPGIKQLSFSYTLPHEAFPLRVPLDSPAEVFEVLLEDQTGTVSAPKLVKQGSVTADGRSFVRWLAEDVPANSVATVTFAEVSRGLADQRLVVWIMAALALAAASLGVLRATVRRRGLYDAAPRAAAGPDPERLARRIAALDAAFERERAPSDERRAQYRAERDALKGELTEALARRAGDR